jgi:hypothetical protein
MPPGGLWETTGHVTHEKRGSETGIAGENLSIVWGEGLEFRGVAGICCFPMDRYVTRLLECSGQRTLILQEHQSSCRKPRLL